MHQHMDELQDRADDVEVQKNSEVLKTLKIHNAQMTYELVGLDRLSTVESMLESMGSKVKAPTKPADILK